MDISLDFQNFHSEKSWFYGLHALTVFALDDSRGHYLSTPNLFIGYEVPNLFPGYHFNFVVGRQKRTVQGFRQKTHPLTHPEPFSFMDDIWQLGLWQGRLNWDYLLTRPKGLTGAFFTVEKELWSMTLFLSGVFLPDHEPVVDISPRGDIYSKNRWFNPLQSDFVIFNRRIEAFYWMEKPYLKNILLNESFAFRFRFGHPQKQWVNLAYAFKPINQTYFKIDGQFSINEDSLNHFIHYQAFKHYLISLDSGIRHQDFEVVLSVTQELPSQAEASELWAVPIIADTLFVSTHFRMDLKNLTWFLDFVELNGIYSFFSHSETNQNRLENNMDFHLTAARFRMHSGVAASVAGSFWKKNNQALKWLIRYHHSLPEQGDWLQVALRWYINKKWRVESYVDILGSLQDRKDSFFNIYRQNDRLRFQVVHSLP